MKERFTEKQKKRLGVAAVIPAAGLSSRMGAFKPLLSLGDKSMAQRVVEALREGGAEHIVVVTGHNAAALESHLSGLGVSFVHNPDYADTSMFHSVRLGLMSLDPSWEGAFVTPVDVPLFAGKTVSILLEARAPLAIPQYRGRSGHPVFLSRHIIDRILMDDGEGGLRGAIQRCGIEASLISVEDEGILPDADTPEAYLRMKESLTKELKQ